VSGRELIVSPAIHMNPVILSELGAALRSTREIFRSQPVAGSPFLYLRTDDPLPVVAVGRLSH